MDDLTNQVRATPADELEDLPGTWCWTKIGAIAELRGEKVDPSSDPDLRFVGMDDIEPNGLHATQNRPFGLMQSSANRFRPGDVLYGRLRPYLNKTALAADHGACSGELLPIVPRIGIEPGFLQYFIHSRRFVNNAMSAVTGDRPRIDFARIGQFDFPLAPSNEQRRIAARIDELFAEIAAGEAALADARKGLETFRRALLKATVTGELTKDWRGQNSIAETGAAIVEKLRKRHPDASPTRSEWTPKSSLPKLPDTWAWCAVEEAGEVQLGRQRAPQHHDGEHMRPYLRVANVLEDRLDLSDVKWMNFTPEEFKTFSLRPEDILLNEGQAPDLLGRPAMYRGEIEDCCFQKTLLRFRAKDGILPDFALIVFRYYMRSGRFKRESRITTNIGHLTQVRFVVMEFPVPPRAEQEAIVDLFGAQEAAVVDTLTLLDAEAADVARLKQAILKAAFEGRLVPQDPADEPAGALLARIAAGRPAQPVKRRGDKTPPVKGRRAKAS
ncbi:hypothetical protein ACQR09_23480 [Bradyrhizobium oligotrophicum]|uniref:hypothetical protein n=1 Tax=Bradyrhizobium oligotrophicum TaxID=44255 RepID=UPI003EB79E66